MSENKLYRKTGELPPQGIGPETVGKPDVEPLFDWEITQFIEEHTDGLVKPGIDIRASEVIITLATSERDGYDKNMGETLRWAGHSLCRDLEFALGTGDMQETAKLTLKITIPRSTFNNCLRAPPEMDEQEGVGDED